MKAKRFFALLLCLVLLLGTVPAVANAAESTISVTCNINGADVYVDNVLTGVTPLTNYAVNSGSHTVEVKLPGYISATKTMSSGSFTANLQPELYPAEYAGKVTYLTVDNDSLYLEDAVARAMADKSDTWYVISFAQGITSATLSQTLNIDRRGKLTIDGGGTVAISKTCPECAVNVICADVRLTGLIFDGSNDFSGNRNMLSLRLPEDYIDEAYHMDRIYITGCRISHTFEVGVATCGDYGHAAKGYDMPGTANFHDLVFSGNTFDRAGLFSFAGAGDEDYNVIDGYYICGNTFTDGGIGMLAGDAHTWYVYDGTPEVIVPEKLAFCEYNILRNVLVSGNSITMTENAPYEYTNIIMISCANLGNSHNLTENVEIRHNTSRLTGGDKNQFSSVSVSGTSVSDSYEEGKHYNQFVKPGMEHTDDNTIRNVYVHDNDFQLGAEREFQVHNMDVHEGEQCGKNNTMENIRIENNIIDAYCGVRICNYQGDTDSGLCENNLMHHITFTGNTLSRTGKRFGDEGVLVAGSYINQYRHDDPPAPDYRGSMYDVTVKDNTITNYQYGVLVCAAAGDYANGISLSQVNVEGNHIVNCNYNTYPIVDFGIAVAGSALQGNTNDRPHRANRNCTVSNVTVKDNDITAGCGICTAGLLVTENFKTYPSTGNAAKNVTITGNTCTHRTFTENNGQQCPGIVTADIVEAWNKLGESTDASGKTGNLLTIAGGSEAKSITLSNNTCTGFVTGQEILHDLTTLSGSDGWQWVADGEGQMARRQDTGLTYYALGELTLNDPAPDDPTPHDPTPDDPTGQEQAWGDLRWTLDENGLLTITGTGPVNRVNDDTPWQHYTDKIRKVRIGEGITAIGECAFTWYPELTDVTLPDTVTAIGEGAFRDCYKLARINLPGSITAIGAEAFKKCTALTAVTLPGNITALEDCTFQECSALTEITLPDSLTRLGDAVFWGCSSLKSITIPDSVTAVGQNMFDGCAEDLIVYAFPGSSAATQLRQQGYNVDTITLVAQYDLNGDGTVNVTDLQSLYTFLSTGTKESSRSDDEFADVIDVNGDDSVNILDYQALYEIIKSYGI